MSNAGSVVIAAPGEARFVPPSRCRKCDGKHFHSSDVIETPIAPAPCESGRWFWQANRTHCSACHAGEDLPPEDQVFPPQVELARKLDRGVLADWYERQKAALEAYALELTDKLAKNHDALKDRGLKDPVWAKLMLMEARYTYASGCRFHTEGPVQLVGTMQVLERAKHCLVCPMHGIPAIPEEEWRAAFGEPDRPMRELYDALGMMGWLTGEMPLAWTRMCETCRKPALELLANQYLKEFKEDRRTQRKTESFVGFKHP